MAIPFSHSMQSLHADRTQSTTVGLSVATMLLLLWAMWFFFAPLSLYENGQIVGARRDGALLAEFPASAAATIAQGQSARILPSGDPTNSVGAIPALVASITNYYDDGSIQVALTAEISSDDPLMVASELTKQGTVEIAVEEISPAALIARASGLLLENGSPQNTVSFSPTH